MALIQRQTPSFPRNIMVGGYSYVWPPYSCMAVWRYNTVPHITGVHTLHIVMYGTIVFTLLSCYGSSLVYKTGPDFQKTQKVYLMMESVPSEVKTVPGKHREQRYSVFLWKFHQNDDRQHVFLVVKYLFRST